MRKIKNWIIDLICREIQVGGWCGLCGAWVDCKLLPVSWPYTICKKCGRSEFRSIFLSLKKGDTQ